MLLGLLLALQIIVAVALVGVILLQRSEGGALGMGGGPSGFMTARGAGDLLTRTTAILAGAFFVLSMILTIVTGHSKGGGSVVDRLKVDALNPSTLNQPPVAGAPPANTAAPAAPAGTQPQPTSPSVFEAPKPQVNTAPQAPAVSSMPVPKLPPSAIQAAPAPQPAPPAPQAAPPATQPAPAR